VLARGERVILRFVNSRGDEPKGDLLMSEVAQHRRSMGMRVRNVFSPLNDTDVLEED